MDGGPVEQVSPASARGDGPGVSGNIVSAAATGIIPARAIAGRGYHAAKDPDFAVQGEYLGQGSLGAGRQGRLGVQVIARSGGKFEAFLLKGGLPGDGWKRGDPRVRIEGKREGDQTTVRGDGFEGKIADGALTLSAKEKGKAELKRTER